MQRNRLLLLACCLAGATIALEAIHALRGRSHSRTVPSAAASRASETAPASGPGTQKATPQGAPVAPAPADQGGKARGEGFTVYFFYERASKGCEAAQEKLAAAVEAVAAPPRIVRVDLLADKSRPLLEKYQVSKAPFSLIVASNGAVTGGFPGAPSPKQLGDALVSPATAEVLLGLNQQKVTLVCAQSAGQTGALESLQSAQAIAQLLPKSVHVIRFDPADPEEGALARTLRLDPSSRKATTLVLAPDGSPVQSFTGVVTKAKLLSAFQSILAGRSGCGGSDSDPLARDCEM